MSLSSKSLPPKTYTFSGCPNTCRHLLYTVIELDAMYLRQLIILTTMMDPVGRYAMSFASAIITLGGLA